MTFRRTSFSLIFLSIILSGCQTSKADIGNESRKANENVFADQALTSNDFTKEGQINSAVESLALELGVSKDSVYVVSSVWVDWNDGSLGCPKNGEQYAQYIVPGIQIILEVSNQRYHYHAAQNQTPFLCPGSRLATPQATDR